MKRFYVGMICYEGEREVFRFRPVITMKCHYTYLDFTQLQHMSKAQCYLPVPDVVCMHWCM